MNGARPFNLDGWLRRPPQPVYVTVDDQRVEVPKTGRPWHVLTETIMAMGDFENIVCHDKDGNILRATKFLNEGVKAEAAAPKGTDPISVFAGHIADAYRTASIAFQPLLTSANDQIARQSDEIARKNQDIDDLRQENNDLIARINELSLQLTAAPQVDETTSLLGAVVQGMNAKQQGVQLVKQAVAPNGGKPK